MRERTSTSRFVTTLTPIGFLAVTLLIWETIARVFRVPAYILPLPTAILAQYFRDGRSLLVNVGVTMSEAVLGFLLANCLAFAVALAFTRSRTIKVGVYPYAIALKTTPIVALAPLLVIWLGTGLASKVAASALICFFPMLVNAVKGLSIESGVDEAALDLFESLGASWLQVFKKLRFPKSLPYVFSALKISTSLSIVGAVVGEFVGANRGVGYIILVSSYHLETDRMFAATAMSAGGGVLFFGLIWYLEHKFVFWQTDEVD